jgi:hypothetical protein
MNRSSSAPGTTLDDFYRHLGLTVTVRAGVP